MTPPIAEYTWAVAVRMAQCAACHRLGWCDAAAGTCLDGCAVDAEAPTWRAPAPAPAPCRPSCTCGGAAADPVSTRRDGGPGHADYCDVRGRP